MCVHTNEQTTNFNVCMLDDINVYTTDCAHCGYVRFVGAANVAAAAVGWEYFLFVQLNAWSR